VPVDDIQVKRIPAVRVAELTATASYYEDAPDGDGVIVHAALPVNADPDSAHGFEITDLPAITQAATIFTAGPWTTSWQPSRPWPGGSTRTATAAADTSAS
jgi:hypothetical protein